MNGYQITADSYRKLLQTEPDIDRAKTEQKIKALDFLASCSKEERLELFNSSAFNDVVKGYVLLALDNLKTDPEQRKAIINEVAYLFDIKRADEAEQYYYDH